jgi:hypothetical protein
MVFQCAGQELNLHSLSGRLLYRQLGSPMPSRRMSSSGAGGSRTRRSPRFELGRFADLRTAPQSSQAPSTGFEPAISCVTGRRALQAAPRGQCISNDPGGTRTHSIPGSKPRWSAKLPTGPCPGPESNLQPPATTAARRCPSQAALPIGVPGQSSSSPGWSRTIVSWVWTKCRCRWTTGLCYWSGVTGNRTRISGLRSRRRPVGP